MDFELFKKIIDEASEVGVKRIYLYLHGESSIHPRIVDMIRHIKLNGLGITMHTNGMLFNKEKIEKILHSGVDSADYFIFSIPGHSKAVHEKIMKGANHERVTKSLLDFIELRKQHKVNGPIIEVIFYRMPENLREEAQFVKHWRGIVDHVHPVGNISNSYAKYKTGAISTPLRARTCKLLWERMVIFWNGDVTICAQDVDGEYVLGNMREKSIKEIWNCNKLLAIKKLHTENNFKKVRLCLRCDE
jgi:radical SAM protein with 4Fe4S-binding SPASM domain